MQEYSSNQNKAISKANANQSIFQGKSEKSSEDKRASFLPPPLTFNAPSIQKKKNESLPEELQTNMGNSFGQDISNGSIQRNSQEAVASNVVQRQQVPQLPEKHSDVKELSLNPGRTYTVTSDDMSKGSEPEIWNYIARNNGMYIEKLKLFNQHVKTIQFLNVTIFSYAKVVGLKEGISIYIPSADELAFLEFRENYSSYEETVQEFGNYLNTSSQEIVRSARSRASGDIGTSYGTDSNTFLTPNKELAGASSRRTETVNEQTEYRVNWGSDLWKCNIFMHDVVYDAGYEPDMSSNDHYITAGKLHKSSDYKQLKVSEVKPGSLVQLYGGTGSNASHNMVLSSFVKRTDNGDGTEKWVFSAIGAEQESSAESIREFGIDPDESTDFYEVTSGGRDYVRFFEPENKR